MKLRQVRPSLARKVMARSMHHTGCTAAELFSERGTNHPTSLRRSATLRHAARMLDRIGYGPVAIGRVLGRDHSTICFYLDR